MVKDYNSREKLGEEIEKIETEYTKAQSWAEEVYGEFSKSNAYCKFVKTQPSYRQESKSKLHNFQRVWHNTVAN